MLAMMVCIFASCSDGGNEEPVTPPNQKPEVNNPTITLDSSIQASGLSFDTSVAEKSITFTTTSDWTLSIAETRSGTAWCTASPTSGGKGTATVKFTTTENTEPEERSVAITIKAGTASKTFTVTQKGADALLVTTSKYEVAQEGGKIEVEVKANIDYQFAISETAKDWITETKSKSRGLTTYKHTFDISRNEEAEKREGEITFKSGDKVETVKVYQAGGAILLLSQNEYTVSDAGETISVDIKSNVEYGVQMPDVDWITDEASSRGMSSHTLKYIIAANEGYDNRSAEIIFYDKNSDLKDTLKVLQVQKDAILVAKNEYVYESVGGNLDFSINTNVDFEISISVDWIKQDVGSRGLIEKALNFIVEDNKSKEPREGEIVFACQELKQTVKVLQKGTVDYEAIERAALAEFYSIAGGDSWVNKTNWCSDKALNEWYGISTDENGRVIEIRLASNGERGDISKIVHTITPLTELKVLYLCPNNTDIYGSFPSEIYNFSNLEILHIDSQLEGEMTIDIKKLSRLKSLSVRGIKISALVLKELCCSLIELEELFFHNCKVEGSIPEEISNLKKLNILNLVSSNIGGLLPESIWDLPLTTLNFGGNHDISGTISPKIKNLKEIRMLDLSRCAFSGSIPMEICECINLEYLWLSDNKFEGSIPDNIGNLKQLNILELQNNNLTGNIPASISQLSNLVVCSLFGNRLSGRVPEEVSDMWSIWVPLNKIVPQQDGYQLTYEDIYASTDYSKDGEIIQLQEHTEGNGIPVILLGDAFVDTDMESGGLYETTMKRAMEAYFSIEPMTSLRPLFDVYLVKCVSENNFIGGKTALSSKHSAEGEGAGGDADMSKCLEYASKVIDDLADVQIKVIMNDKQQIGYCAYLEDNCTISFNSLFDQGSDWQNFEAVFRHEAIGHGFGLLADEYADHIKTITEEEMESLRHSQLVGYNLNVDVINNSEQVLWSKFLSDDRYANEDLGIYEGGWASFTHGVYRPSYNSIMRYNEPIFNAPSREAIYKRAMKLAYGEGWEYDYEEFVKFDEKSRDEISRSAIKPLTEAEQKEYIKTHRPPIFIKGTWRDIMKNKR